MLPTRIVPGRSRWARGGSARAAPTSNTTGSCRGYDRGIYGAQGAELMRYIQSGGAQATPATESPATQWRIGPFEPDSADFRRP
jgi:hypothetical protein